MTRIREIITPDEVRMSRREMLAASRDIGLAALTAAVTVQLAGVFSKPEQMHSIYTMSDRQYLHAQHTYTGDYLSYSKLLLPEMLGKLGDEAGREVVATTPSAQATLLAEELSRSPLPTNFYDLEDQAAQYGLFFSCSGGVGYYKDPGTGIVYDAFFPILRSMPPESASRLTSAVSASSQAAVGVVFSLDQAEDRIMVCEVN